MWKGSGLCGEDGAEGTRVGGKQAGVVKPIVKY